MKWVLKGMFATALLSGVMLPVTSADAGSSWIFDQNASYTSLDDSPWSSFVGDPDFFFENFEEDAILVNGLSLSSGEIRTPGEFTDSVDFDDGTIDGLGQLGHSWRADPVTSGDSLTISFDEAVFGALPTLAGFVWTDGNVNAEWTIQALDSNGNEILTALEIGSAVLGGDGHRGSTAGDRFIGLSADQGIAQLLISWNAGASFELDHIQWGFEGVIIPLPPALALGLAGFGLVALRRRFKTA